LACFAPELAKDHRAVGLQAEVEIKYAWYVKRQIEGVERSRKMERVRLPEDMDYSIIRGLSQEVREKLTRVCPRSLGQASRISGITPAAISLLSVYVKRRKIA
ncbi:MAG: tRNA uridine-5-carboxymethylaminomethyl(34) synthesis enzyme MnmG, partial [Deltaproteobacteria bacterium]|nr:tRNA uridine-5-carboxymethylaminomethyl(34) synthesis enzyme MnmG [Deltaproteobacteria bacterium]